MKIEKRLILPLALTIMLSAMFLASFAGTARAQAGAQLTIDPAAYTYVINYTTPPATIVYNVSVTNVTGLASWQWGIQFDPTMLTYQNSTVPTFNVFGSKSIVTAGDHSTAGIVIFSAALLDPTQNFTGSGVLAQLELNVIATPPALTNVSFEAIGTDTFLLNSLGTDISFGYTNSMFAEVYYTGTTVTHTIPGSTNLVATTSNGTIQANSAVINTTTKTISFNITGNTGDTTFLYAQLPKDVINVTADDLSDWNWTLNGVLQPQSAFQITENATYTNIFIPQFTFGAQPVGIQGDNIIPELSSMLIVMLIASSATVAIVKSRTRKKL